MSDIPISYPGKYAPGVAINFAGPTGMAQLVSATSPLPVVQVSSASAQLPVPAPLTGDASAAYRAGPYAPLTDRPLILTLTGAWTGTVKLLRARAAGASPVPVTVAGSPWAVFTGNACEPVWEETEAAAVFYLDLAPASGTVTYRLEQ